MAHEAASATADRTARLFGVPLVVVFLFIGMMLPTGMSVDAGGLRLSPYRIVLIVMFVPMVLTLIGGKRGRANVFDLLVAGHSVLVLLALIKWGGPAQGIESGGIYIVEFAGAYLVGRLYIRSYQDFAAFARVFVALVTGMLIFTLPEALTGAHVLHDGFAAISGSPPAPYIDQRLGLERAFGPFDHPILYGVFSASALSMAYFVVAGRRIGNLFGMAQVLGVAVATFVSASGGPYVVLMMQVLVIGWERVFAGFKGRWSVLFTLFGISYLAIDLLSNRTPFHVFVSYLTFSAQSAYNRINIWNYGTAEVARQPFLGIGLGDWIRAPWMSDSMDNFWLLIAVRYGVPALLLLLGLMLGLLHAVARRKDLPEAWVNARHAWAFTLFGITIAAATVHLWNALFVLFIFFIGSGIWMYEADPAARRRPAVAGPLNRPSRRQSCWPSHGPSGGPVPQTLF